MTDALFYLYYHHLSYPDYCTLAVGEDGWELDVRLGCELVRFDGTELRLELKEGVLR